MTTPRPEPQSIPQYSNDEVVGINIVRNGSPADPDGQAVRAIVTADDGATILDRPATRKNVGTYEVLFDGGSTDRLGPFLTTFYYTIAGTPEKFEIPIIIESGSPAYNVLPDDFQSIVDGVRIKFADLFDSPDGGPYLLTQYQAHFTPSRYAQLLGSALGKLHTSSQPYMSYTLNPDDGPLFPVAKWGALLSQALYVEVISHLRRSYTEQPDFRGGNVARLDRRDYFDRWGIILQEEREQLARQLDTYKIAHMMMGRPRVLVSGGAYGRYGPTRRPTSAAARPRYWTTYYAV